MTAAGGAQPFVPPEGDIDELRRAARSCRGCSLYQNATQSVFGAGPAGASLFFIGEQPGDREDIEGLPFVGPAGRLLDRALAEVGIPRDSVYVTNAVKHFKFARQDRGKPRIHKKPSRAEVIACRPWLTAELELIRPRLIVCLGATAAQAVLGASFRLTHHRGELVQAPHPVAADEPVAVLATVHPSAVLRAPDRDAMYRDFVADLRVAAAAVAHA